MSAYIVDRNHILYLVQAAADFARGSYGFSWYHNGEYHKLDSGDFEQLANLAMLMWGENIKSVGHRYPGESSATLPGPIDEEFKIEAKDIGHCFDRFDPVQILKSCNCYEYQSCEHPEWQESEAHCVIDSLISSAIHSLPGYDEAEWGAPEVKQNRNIIRIL